MSGPSSPYISRKDVSDSYRPKGYGLSPGLLRARQRFRVRNVLTGAVIASFGVGVWAYSISAVRQDTFDDADEEAKALAASREKSLKVGTAQRLKADVLWLVGLQLELLLLLHLPHKNQSGLLHLRADFLHRGSATHEF
ncbi:hypothetical protein BD410DRAFT_797984 [Rickenella mellea]|uniref:Cytochrome c oxidase assembly factor 3 n=1 Tax=Rickenella mellea TaxID=50990 RepID=A0A4R5XF29_9AGAM|nr:hypothetical protein BD410DRAFT_797984 [Rickenella mellea]